MIGTCIAVFAWALAIWLALGLFRVGGKSQDDVEIIERRTQPMSHLPPDHPGTIIKFRRRA